MVLEVSIDDNVCNFRERPYNFVANWTMADALNRIDDAFLNATKLRFNWVRFEEDDIVGALQACLDRAIGRGHLYEEIAFHYCASELCCRRPALAMLKGSWLRTWRQVATIIFVLVCIVEWLIACSLTQRNRRKRVSSSTSGSGCI
jgi:hypothetical protein